MSAKIKARTGAEFAQKHIRENAAKHKIEGAIAKIKAVGSEHWEYETDLQKPPYSVALRDFAEARGSFDAYWLWTEVQDGEKPRRVWFGDPKVASKYRTKPNNEQE